MPQSGNCALRSTAGGTRDRATTRALDMQWKWSKTVCVIDQVESCIGFRSTAQVPFACNWILAPELFWLCIRQIRSPIWFQNDDSRNPILRLR